MASLPQALDVWPVPAAGKPCKVSCFALFLSVMSRPISVVLVPLSAFHFHSIAITGLKRYVALFATSELL